MKHIAYLLLLPLILAFASCDDENTTGDDVCAAHTCEANSHCVIDNGAPLCICDEGFSGDPCVVDDPCDPNPCTDLNRTICDAEGGEVTCGCDTGYHLEGEVCVPDDPCDPNPCTGANRSLCVVENNEATCNCDDGFHLDGEECVPNDPCTPNPCTEANRTVCVATGSEASCDCDEGYHLEGDVCVQDDPCDPNPCTDIHKSVCTDDNGVALCSCDPGYMDNGSGGCMEEPLPTCTNSHSDGDSYEPDECPALATPVVLGTPQTHSIYNNGDEDWYQFTVQAGHIYHIYGNQSDVDLVVALYEPDGSSQILSLDSASLNRELDVAGTYYVKVRGYSTASLGNYTLTVTDLGLDDHGDGHLTATTVAVGSTTPGIIETPGDNDWFAFTAQAGHIYELVSDQSNLDTYHYLMDTDGNTTLISTDNSRTVFEIPTAGVYYVRLRAYSGSSRGDYSITINDLGLDDHGDDASVSTPLTLETAQQGEIETGGDNDWFAFTAQAGHIYRITSDQSSFDTYHYLIDQDGSSTLISTDNSNLYYEIESAGTYYVRVRGYSGSSLGSYAITVEDLGLDDHGDDALLSTPISLATSEAGEIETGGDNDWFAFDAEAGHIYAIQMDQSSLDTYVYLYDTDGASLITSSDYSITHELATAGTYYIRARAYSGTSRGTYSVTVTDLGLDDHGDDAASATSITLPASESGAIETGGDNDWFAFDAVAGTTYTLTVDQSSLDTYQYLYEPDGTTTLGYSDGSTITRTVSTTGTHYIRIRAYSGSSKGSYSFTLTTP